MTKTQILEELAIELAENWFIEEGIKLEIRQLEQMENSERNQNRVNREYRNLWKQEEISNQTLKIGGLLGLKEVKLREKAWIILLDKLKQADRIA